MNTARPEQAEHDRRHGRQVVDVDLDEVRPAVLVSELFEINRRGHADRERQDAASAPA